MSRSIKPFMPISDEEQSSPFKFWVLTGGMVWRNCQVIFSWEQTLLNDQFSQLNPYNFFIISQENLD